MDLAQKAKENDSILLHLGSIWPQNGSIFAPFLSPFWDPFWAQFWVRFGAISGAFLGALRAPLLSRNTRKQRVLDLFGASGWPLFGPLLGSILGSFWAPFGAILGPLLAPFWAIFGDFLENLDFRIPSRPQTPSDLVFVLGANKSFSRCH